MRGGEVRIRAPINIALIKYWGKLHEAYNVPLNSSLSLTLDKECMYSETVMVVGETVGDSFVLRDKGGEVLESVLPKNFDKLKIFFTAYAKERYGLESFGAQISSLNTFPTKAGLASSASGLSCMALCMCRVFNYFEENEEELKIDIFENIKKWFLENNKDKIVKVFAIVLLLRIISGSSCRSTYLFAVLQIGPELLTEDFYDGFNQYTNDTSISQIEDLKTNKNILHLSNWKYTGSLVQAGIELNKYFKTNTNCKNDPSSIYSRFNYAFTCPKDWNSISNKCIAFPLTNIGSCSHNQLVDFFAGISMVVCLLHKEQKKIGSTDGMVSSALTSQSITKRVDIVRQNILTLLKSIQDNDISAFLTVVMRDSNNFHSVCLDTHPPLFYLSDKSRDVINYIHDFNAQAGKVVAGYTFDAGPNPFILLRTDYRKQFLDDFVQKFEVLEDNLINVNILV